jgi:hypothetical protein
MQLKPHTCLWSHAHGHMMCVQKMGLVFVQGLI